MKQEEETIYVSDLLSNNVDFRFSLRAILFRIILPLLAIALREACGLESWRYCVVDREMFFRMIDHVIIGREDGDAGRFNEGWRRSTPMGF